MLEYNWLMRASEQLNSPAGVVAEAITIPVMASGAGFSVRPVTST